MIIVRTPLRISLGGGGTDLPSYYERHGGFVLSAAIDKHIYITANRAFRSGYLLKYSKTEHVRSAGEIEHAIFRAVIEHLDIDPSIELVSIADVPAGTGMGSSGSFTVGLLHALRVYERLYISQGELAALANHIEMTVLGEPCGKQDHYIAAYGGLLCQRYEPDGSVSIDPLTVDEATVSDLNESLMLFFTGYSRDAAGLLADQARRTDAADGDMLDRLHRVKVLGHNIKDALEAGDTEAFARLMDEHWRSKRQRSPGISSDGIDRLYDLALENGAIGGKLVGAGGGGFLLLYTRNRSQLRRVMTDAGLKELPFGFDFDGTVVQMRN